MARRVLILGAAGRDFHNFNTLYRDDPEFEVVGFTAAQIPNIADRRYPPELAGALYPQGIPVFSESQLESLVRQRGVDLVIFSYSDVSHEHVMHLAARSLAQGASYYLAGEETMLKAARPVVAVTAVRTGAGKSQTSRKVRSVLAKGGKQVAVVRHPMAYGDLTRQRLQRFDDLADLAEAGCTIEEREEYEPHLREGAIVYSGIDYQAVLRSAEQEADVILWDGGNNDLPFFRPDVHICVADPHRPGHELRYWPGEANFRRADVVVINKVDTAPPEAVQRVRANLEEVNPDATLILAASPIRAENPGLIKDRRVLVIEDGPTLTHGEMTYGAGVVAARQHEAAELIDPRPHAVGSIRRTLESYPELGPLVPAMGYGEEQQRELAETIVRAAPDSVVVASPINLMDLLELPLPHTLVHYELEEVGDLTLAEVLEPLM
ncbi:MAG: cyclic 2,3-diphosphoglycerate synthase [Actinomycetota bacterium]|nr:cyclic 2,3-diphosphoglycerate synthase [Actinomycetota bacterium]